MTCERKENPDLHLSTYEIHFAKCQVNFYPKGLKQKLYNRISTFLSSVQKETLNGISQITDSNQNMKCEHIPYYQCNYRILYF